MVLTSNGRIRMSMLLAIEGIDGSGKSTLARGLTAALRRRGRRVALVSEPSSGTFGRRARAFGADRPLSAALFFTMDRTLVRPALEQALRTHDLVIQDRSFYSTLAYQGGQIPRALRLELGQLEREVARVPDHVLLLHGPVDLALQRVRTRSRTVHPLEKRRLLARVQAEYLALARKEPARFTRLPFAMTGPEILERALRALDPWV